MWEPVGPLPASVYWRRRLVAITATLGLLVVAAWSAAAWMASSAPPAVTTAVLAAVDQTAPPTTDPAAPKTPADPAVVVVPAPVLPTGPTATTGPATTQATPGSRPATPGPPPTTTRGADPTEQLLPDDTAPRTGPAPSPVPVPATGPVPCTDAMLAVGAGIDQPSHRVGERPRLRLVVTNTSAQPCVRDLDPIRQEIVVWGPGGARLWSSNDCSTAQHADLRTLVPGQPVVFVVSWAGRTSAPGCAGVRTTVPAGSYTLLTRVDDVISGPTSFTRTP